MRVDKLITRAADHCGGLTRFAESLQVTPQVVVNWRARGVPVSHCAAFEAASGNTVRRWELRPDDWHRIWPELIGTDGAPEIAEPAKEGA